MPVSYPNHSCNNSANQLDSTDSSSDYDDYSDVEYQGDDASHSSCIDQKDTTDNNLSIPQSFSSSGNQNDTTDNNLAISQSFYRRRSVRTSRLPSFIEKKFTNL